MAKNKQKKKRWASNQKSRKKAISLKIIFFVIIAVILVAAIAIAAAVYRIEIGRGIEDGLVQSAQQEEQKKTGFSFPYELEDGKLEVTALFQYTGMNPDCNNITGENIAALSLTNMSEEYLSSAQIVATLEDETELNFEITDVPSGKTVIVFSNNNTTYNTDLNCKAIGSEAQFSEDATLMEDELTIQVEETQIVLTNITQDELTNLDVYCHCLLDGDYFGGLTYIYPVESIPAGSSVTVSAEDCYMGEAEVIRIARDN